MTKAAIDRIRTKLDGGLWQSAIAIYQAVCRICSDENSETFQKSIGYITTFAGGSDKTTRRRLDDLAEIGLLSIDKKRKTNSKEWDFHTITLLSTKQVWSQSPEVWSEKQVHRDRVIEEENKSIRTTSSIKALIIEENVREGE